MEKKDKLNIVMQKVNPCAKKNAAVRSAKIGHQCSNEDDQQLLSVQFPSFLQLFVNCNVITGPKSQNTARPPRHNDQLSSKIPQPLRAPLMGVVENTEGTHPIHSGIAA